MLLQNAVRKENIAVPVDAHEAVLLLLERGKELCLRSP